MDAQLAGRPCDSAARESQVAAAKQATQAVLTAACAENQLQQLHFVDVNEAQADVARACGDQADAAISVLYGPALATGSTASGNPDMRQCLAHTAAMGQKLLHFATRVKRTALDRIAARNPSPEQRQALLANVSGRIAAARQKVIARVDAECPGFSSMYGANVTQFLSGLELRSDCVVGLAYVQSAVKCPLPVCGNGVKETGEQCDDGNGVDGDLCHNNCTKNDCSVFPSTFALIQTAIFENHGCTNDLCHGVAKSGNLDLRAGASYAALVGTPSLINPSMKRVEPGDGTNSLLWLKLAAATLGRTDVPGSPMPNGGLTPLSLHELDAVSQWIHAFALETGTVQGVAELLDACAVPADPVQIESVEAPAKEAGVQMHMPQWKLPAKSEDEVCFVSYYDFTNSVPEAYLGADRTTFRFHQQKIVQDPQSHHLIVNLYTGTSTIDDPAWGAFTCKGGALDGQSCDPKRPDSCGATGLCGSEPTSSVACIGFGPADAQVSGFAGFTGTQQTSYEQTFADGVYEEVPLKGIIIWNSHAFNLTQKNAKQESWLNFYFAQPSDQQYPVNAIFDLNHIFDMVVPPFQTEEVCATHVIERGARLFQLSSHMHKRGKRFTIFAPDGSLMYTSNIYNDPIQLNFDPPLVFDKAAPSTRTLRYCALYDNGATNTNEVKRQSTSPPTPIGFPFGGPCATATGCTAGNVGQQCSGNNQTKRNASCDTSPGAGDGVCDACTLTGGVTTEDEMFILLGSYYKQ